MVSRKQELYIEILDLLLPHARNVQTWSFFDRAFRGDLFPELELMHNIPPLVREEGFNRNDIYWLNVQAANYLSACGDKERPHSSSVKRIIKDLMELVPDGFRQELTIIF